MSSIKYVRKIFRKNDISNPLIRIRRCAHQGVRKVSFLENSAYALNGWSHIETVFCKVNKVISIIKKLRHTLPRKSLRTIYKAFLRYHIDCGDIIYDQPSDESFCEKLESVQYKAAFSVTGAIQGTSREKNFMELGVQSLKSRICFRRLCCIKDQNTWIT